MTVSVTVIIPVHNNAKTLVQVITAVKNELQPEDSILAVNDRSTDNSVEILHSLNIPVKNSTGKPGAAGTRNTGGFAAENDWILFVDADAVVPSGWRKKLTKRLQDVQAIQAVYSRNAVGTTAATFYKNYYYFHTFTRRIKGPYIKGCGTFFFAVQRKLFTELNGFDENITGATIEDADFAERLWACGGKILITPEIEVFHLRQYKTLELFRYEWKMMKAKALYILRRDKSRGAPSVSVAGFKEMLPVLSGAVFVWLFLAGIILWLFGFQTGLFISSGSLLITITGQLTFMFYAIKDGGFRGVKACFFILPDLLLIVPSMVAAALTYLNGKKY